MSRGPITFRQRDVSAAMKAATDAGYAVDRVEIDKAGKITVFVAGRDGGSPPPANPWEELANEEVAIRSKF
jgi:hypothetical protein